MIVPSQAIVRPRAVCPETGESLPLEEMVESFIERHSTGAIEIVGPPGSGKTTALAHLAEVISTGCPVLYLDDAKPEDVAAAKMLRPVIYTAKQRWPKIADVSFELSPWGEDDMIEFLLATRPDRCQSVLARIRSQPDRQLLGGNPELWRVVLERMIREESDRSLREVLAVELRNCLPRLPSPQPIYEYALARIRCLEGLSSLQRECLVAAGTSGHLLRLLRHCVTHVILATDYLSDSLEQGRFAYQHFRHLPNELIRETAAAVRDSRVAMNTLQIALADPNAQLHPIAASILHATQTGWRPAEFPAPPHGFEKLARAAQKLTGNFKELPTRLPCLESAHLEGANWAGIRLPHARLNGAVLSGEISSNSVLAHAQAVGCCLQRATLREADLTAANLRHANLHAADCTGAVFRRADLQTANLKSACFRSAQFGNADLRGAMVAGADFSARISPWPRSTVFSCARRRLQAPTSAQHRWWGAIWKASACAAAISYKRT